jgi:hypothetical protein
MSLVSNNLGNGRHRVMEDDIVNQIGDPMDAEESNLPHWAEEDEAQGSVHT